MTAKNTARARACAVQTSTGTTRSGQALKICTVSELAGNFKMLVMWLWQCLMFSQDSNLAPHKQAWTPRGHNNAKSCFLKIEMQTLAASRVYLNMSAVTQSQHTWIVLVTMGVSYNSSPVAWGGKHWLAERSEGQNGWTYLRSERLLIE